MLWVIEFVGKRKFFDQLAEDVFFSWGCSSAKLSMNRQVSSRDRFI
jgi:hypothetical protein